MAGFLKNVESGKVSAIISLLKIWGKERGYVEQTDVADKTRFIESFDDLIGAADMSMLHFATI